MKQHKNKILIGLCVAALLVLAFWYGGNAPSLRGSEGESRIAETLQTADNAANGAAEQTAETSNTPTASAAAENRPQKSDGTHMTAEEKIALANSMAESQSTEAGRTAVTETAAPKAAPAPVEPEKTQEAEREQSCTLSVRCDSVLQHMDWLEQDKHGLIPPNGEIFAERTVTFYEGESVFDLLQREMKQNKIHMEFENTPLYQSAYIEGIANLYEFDCGELSGWMYKVNGVFPDYGCSRYRLQSGDKVEWVYTCDLGADVGGRQSAQTGS